MYFLTVTFICAALVAFGNADPVARLANGQEVDNLRQFPHHVYIIPFNSDRKCGGSILNAQWVLTSAACIKDSVRVELHFGKQNEFDYGAAYHSISVNNDQVYVYPTNYDDLALIRLPMRLIFSDTVSPVNISRQSMDTLRNKFAVLPGFNEITYQTTSANPSSYDSLRYGMFNVVDANICKQKLGSGRYDEYTQLCTEGWGSNPNTPCDSDFGSGLIIGWPAKSELVGMFSMYSPSCDISQPAVYTYIPKYISWIDSMIQG